MKRKSSFVWCTSALLQLSFLFTLINGQSEWVWGKGGQNGENVNNNIVGSGPGGFGSNGQGGLVPVSTVNIFGNPTGGSGSVSGFGGGSGNSGDRNFPASPSIPASPSQQPTVVVQVLQPGSSSSTSGGDGSTKSGGTLPANSIRAVQGEPRLFTRQIRRFVQNAVNNLANNNGGNTGGVSNINSLSPGAGILGALLALGPAFIGNRYPNLPSSGGLPISSSGTGSSSKPISSSGGGGGFGSNSGRVCACVADDQCRLPSIVMGSCSSGVMCCKSSGVRIIGGDDGGDTRTSKTVVRTSDIRAGLFGEIVRGTSNVIDDALDLILAPFLTQEDQEKLANRLASPSSSSSSSSSRRSGSKS